MDCAFFGLQVAVLSPVGDPWRQRLVDIVRPQQRGLSLEDKRVLYGSVGNLLAEAVPRLVLGHWDYLAAGRAEYDAWVHQLEQDAQQHWINDSSGAVMDHALVSLLFLLPRGRSAEIVAERCDLAEEVWTARSTFEQMIETVQLLGFASVLGDAVYLTPGDPGLAFSLAELCEPEYQHLQPVT